MNRLVIRVDIEVSSIKEVLFASCEFRQAAVVSCDFNTVLGLRLSEFHLGIDLYRIAYYNAVLGNTLHRSKCNVIAKFPVIHSVQRQKPGFVCLDPALGMTLWGQLPRAARPQRAVVVEVATALQPLLCGVQQLLVLTHATRFLFLLQSGSTA